MSSSELLKDSKQSLTAQPAIAAPVLSTPDTHIFEAPTPVAVTTAGSRLSDGELKKQYEIQRTVNEIAAAGWKRVALQFPDEMLGDAVRVYELLDRALNDTQLFSQGSSELSKEVEEFQQKTHEVKLCILGDTSYGACCVDEIAAEHVDAQAVVHYGRTCLSATARLPVVYVYTTRRLDMRRVVDSFMKAYDDKTTNVVLVADAPYSTHLHELDISLKTNGYSHIFPTELISNGKSQIPNRTLPAEVIQNSESLRNWHIFHIGQPPTALLLTLSSRAASMTVYGGDRIDDRALTMSSALTLRRRYALVTSLSTCSVYGILINTLSVKNYLHIVERVKQQIIDAGKKHYMFVVGKVNAAKIANFSEVGGWVVIGCWESSLVESSEFYVPLITPFELQLALQADDKRIWTGEWTSNFEAVLDTPRMAGVADASDENHDGEIINSTSSTAQNASDYDSEEESAPPEFDLRTGRYIPHSRPLQREQNRSRRHKAADEAEAQASSTTITPNTALVARPKGDIARVGGIVSPGAEYLRSRRTWQGLGSDFELETDFTTQPGAVIEEGRSGVARGYTVGEDENKS